MSGVIRLGLNTLNLSPLFRSRVYICISLLRFNNYLNKMGNLSRSQQKAIFASLKEKGMLRKKPKKITVEGNFIRARVENPKKFQKKSFRRIDVGRKGGTEIIIARPKGSKKTKTQAVLVPKTLFFDGKRFRKI